MPLTVGTWGLFAKPLNYSSGVNQGSIFTFDGNPSPVPASQVVVNLWDNTDTHYKIWGGGAVSTIVRDNNGGWATMYAPEAPEVLLEDLWPGSVDKW